MKRQANTLLSLVLIFSMLFSCGGVAAFAEQTVAEVVTATGAGDVNKKTVAQDIHVTEPGKVDAATVIAELSGEAGLTVDGEVIAESTNSLAEALVIKAEDSGEATGKVTEGLTAVSELGNATALDIDASHGGSSTADIMGDIVATAPEGTAVGIDSNAIVPGSSIDTTVTGDVTADGDVAIGIRDIIDSGVSADITVNGDLNAIGDTNAYGIALPSPAGAPGDPADNETNIHVTGEMSVESEGSATGFFGQSDGNSDVTITVDQDVSVVGAFGASGVDMTADHGSFELNIGGDLSVRSDTFDVAGIETLAYDDGKIDVEVADELKVEGNGTGIHAVSNGDAVTNITVGGPMTVTGGVYVAGLTMEVNEGNVKAEIGALTVTSESYHDASAINITTQNGTAQVEVQGDVQTNGFGINVTMANEGTGTSEVIVQGDVNAGVYGVQALTEGESSVVSDIFINGTLNAEEHAVVINETTTKDNLKITVYEVKLDEDGNAVVGKTGSDETYVNGNTREVEASIMYIIKVQQPTEGGTLTAVKEDGSALDQSHGENVAREGDVVMMKVDLAPGYVVTGAYSVDGHELNIYEKDGQYYVEVPKGGGVYVSARVEKGPEDDVKDDSEEENNNNNGGNENRYPDFPLFVPAVPSAGAVWTDGVQYIDVVFDFNGGHKPASLFAGPVVKTVPVGTWVVLIDAPVKEEADFICWQSDNEDVTVSKPGQNFCALEPIVFTAIWSDDEAAASEDETAAIVAAEEETEDAAVPTAEYETPEQEEAGVTAEEEKTAAEETAEKAEQKEADAPVGEKASEDETVKAEEEPIAKETDEAVTEEPNQEKTAEAEEESVAEETTNAAAITLASLLNSDGSGLKAKLVVDLGNGSSLEIPIDIQLSFGDAVIVTS